MGGRPLGRVHTAWRNRILTPPTPFRCSLDGAIEFDPSVTGFGQCSEAMARWAEQARARWGIPGWRNERMVVFDGPHPQLSIERALLRPFGMLLRSVQACVYTQPPGAAPTLWVARRALTKPIDPGCLDALVAGGIAGFDDAFNTLVRECKEEAGIPEFLARQAQPAGSLDIAYDTTDDGLEVTHRETVALHDLALPADFQPVPVDGEHEAIVAMSPSQARQSMDQDAWTRDGAQALRSLLERKGW